MYKQHGAGLFINRGDDWPEGDPSFGVPETVLNKMTYLEGPFYLKSGIRRIMYPPRLKNLIAANSSGSLESLDVIAYPLDYNKLPSKDRKGLKDAFAKYQKPTVVWMNPGFSTTLVYDATTAEALMAKFATEPNNAFRFLTEMLGSVAHRITSKEKVTRIINLIDLTKIIPTEQNINIAAA